MNALVEQLKTAGQDFEFYPTTDEIIRRLVADLADLRANGLPVDHEGHHFTRSVGFSTVLDIGAGDGKVLRALRKATFEEGRRDEPRPIFSEFYAIEKALPLLQRLEPDVFIVGTDFLEQSLVAKQIDVTFCNPPYSEFTDWARKIIRESSSRLVYLVIPTRWKDSPEIAAAIKHRDATPTILGEFSFVHAEDRAARAVVNLIRIELSAEKDDAFDRFFDEQFADLKARFKGKPKDDDEEKTHEDPRFKSLVGGSNLPERLVALYDAEVANIQRNYDLVAKLDADLLREINVTPAGILGSLKARLTGLRNVYWQELFSHMSQVTNRLCQKKRNALLATLQKNGHVDFTVSNIHAVVIWVLKNANAYLDEQLIEVFESMVEKANVRNYKSNRRAFTYDRWRYAEEKPTHIALEFRLVLAHCGGIRRGYSFERGLSDQGCEFLGDLLTVAHNLGFLCDTTDARLNRALREKWESGTCETFRCMINGKNEPLVEVRAFYNNNLHVRLNQKFALALNVEVGRLKGWVKSGDEAADELGDQSAKKYFRTLVQLCTSHLPMLGAPAPVEEMPTPEPAQQPELAFGT